MELGQRVTCPRCPAVVHVEQVEVAEAEALERAVHAGLAVAVLPELGGDEELLARGEPIGERTGNAAPRVTEIVDWVDR